MSQKTSKTTVETVLWSSFGRYKVGTNVSYNGSVWINTTGKNSEPGVGSDFLITDVSFKSLITKKDNQGNTVLYTPNSDTDISRGIKFLEVLNSASSGDYITVYQGVYEAYIPIQANLDNVTIEFKDGAILTSDDTRDLISNDDTYDITLNITGRGVFINTSIIGNKDRAINISDATTLNIQGKKLISQEGVCIRVDKVFGGGSIINAKFDYYGSKDGTFDNVDNTSVYNLYGDYAVSSENFVLENDGGIINCYIKTIEALDANPIERATSGVINVYNSLVIAPTGEVLAYNLSTPENLNFYNCTGVCDVTNPIQTYYTGTIFINSDFYTDSGALLVDKTDNTPLVKKDLDGDVVVGGILTAERFEGSTEILSESVENGTASVLKLANQNIWCCGWCCVRSSF